MADPPEDRSMVLWGLQRPFVNREIAVALAEMLTAKCYGADELEMQRPFKVSEDADRWILTGSREQDDENPVGQLIPGKVFVEILKRNCQVIKFIQSTGLVPPDPNGSRFDL